MKSHLDTNPYSTRSQMMFILLAVLHNRNGGFRKVEVLDLIQQAEWFDKKAEDNKPFPSKVTKEPRWMTSFAYARKVCVEEGLFVDDGVEDSWQITKDGINVYVDFKSKFEQGELGAHKCYMWTPKFKRHVSSSYDESGEDIQRPPDVYKDFGFARLVNKYLDLI